MLQSPRPFLIRVGRFNAIFTILKQSPRGSIASVLTKASGTRLQRCPNSNTPSISAISKQLSMVNVIKDAQNWNHTLPLSVGTCRSSFTFDRKVHQYDPPWAYDYKKHLSISQTLIGLSDPVTVPFEKSSPVSFIISPFFNPLYGTCENGSTWYWKLQLGAWFNWPDGRYASGCPIKFRFDWFHVNSSFRRCSASTICKFLLVAFYWPKFSAICILPSLRPIAWFIAVVRQPLPPNYRRGTNIQLCSNFCSIYILVPTRRRVV